MAGRDIDPMPATLNGLDSDTQEEDALGRQEQDEAKGSFHTLHTKRPWEDPTEHQQKRAAAAILDMDVRDIEDIEDLGGLLQVLNLEEKGKGANCHFPDIFMSDSDEEGEESLGNTLHRRREA